MWKAPVLIAAVLVVCVASSADARRRHHGYYGYGGYGESSSRSSTLDQWRARQQDQNGGPSRGDDRALARGRDRGDDRTQGRGQNAQSVGQDRSLDRGQDLGQDRGRYDRRRYRHSDWRQYREERRRARDEDRGRDRGAPARTGTFGATIEKLVRNCLARAADFANWPLDAIGRTVAPDETQRTALETLRGKAKEAGERLAAECPREVPAAPAARLEAAEQGLAATLSAFDTVEPALKAFYAALNDEQKARLYRDMAANAAVETTGRAEAQDERDERRDTSSRRHRSRASREDTAQHSGAPGWNGTCEELAGVLRNWPVREIERDVRLTSAQRVAFYELVTSVLKAGDTLANACPGEAALTPVDRMEAMRQRLSAVRAAIAAIRLPLARFYEALD